MIRIAVIGFGLFGNYHLNKYNIIRAEGGDIEVYTCDSNKSFPVDFHNYEDLLGRVDAVSITTPSSTHYSIAEFFLLNGVDVFIEKPITTKLRHANRLIHIADRENRILQVGHIERYNIKYLEAAAVVRDSIPLMIECNRSCYYNGRCSDVSVVLDLMIHDIDIILRLVKSKVKKIISSGINFFEKNDIVIAMVLFENGTTAHFRASRVCKNQDRNIRIYNEGKIYEFNFIDDKGDNLLSEIKDFIRAVKDRSTPVVDGKQARDALELALQIDAHTSIN